MEIKKIQKCLDLLGIELPPPGGPKANYLPVQRDGDLLYLSGHLPIKLDGSLILGACAPSHVLKERSEKYISTEKGYEAAKHCALNLVSTVSAYLAENVSSTDGKPANLSNIVKIIKIFGIVRSHDDFLEHHLVMNGASDVLGQVLGKEVGGCHARSAIGTNTLPLGIAVEVEMICKISM